MGRLAVFTGDPNQLAACIGIVGLSSFLFFRGRAGGIHLVAIGMVAVALGYLMGWTASRGGLCALIISILFFEILRFENLKKTYVKSSIFLMGCIVAVLLSPGMERLELTYELTDGSARARHGQWSSAVEMLSAAPWGWHEPGYWYTQLYKEVPFNRPTHSVNSIYLDIILSYGLIGVIFVTAILVSVLYGAIKLRKSSNYFLQVITMLALFLSICLMFNRVERSLLVLFVLILILAWFSWINLAGTWHIRSIVLVFLLGGWFILAEPLLKYRRDVDSWTFGSGTRHVQVVGFREESMGWFWGKALRMLAREKNATIHWTRKYVDVSQCSSAVFVDSDSFSEGGRDYVRTSRRIGIFLFDVYLDDALKSFMALSIEGARVVTLSREIMLHYQDGIPSKAFAKIECIEDLQSAWVACISGAIDDIDRDNIINHP